ncbi:DgyrCDS13336 [Dimorphilus gyrociliatus]|uniref:DgyrCDS13336 n=1 Tax=Dimorphilus gyrociliatus TaxID=2664684 RepID=A0A7I8WAD6_9ANNE|nr:DgyrCDS13336 [Dimorphilus gyrociliatus]
MSSIHIVDDHDRALEVIYKEIGSKRIPFEGLVLVHFDAHPDLLIPAIKANDIYNKDIVFQLSIITVKNLYYSQTEESFNNSNDLNYRNTDIASWIIPATYAGHIKKVIWLKPPWVEDLFGGFCSFQVGKHRDTGDIRVSCESEYFIQELFYSPKDELVNRRSVDIEEFTVNSDNLKDITECIRKENQEHLLLDIDLDFFSTLNPLKNLFGLELFSFLSEKYRCEFPQSLQPLEKVQQRREQLNILWNWMLKNHTTNFKDAHLNDDMKNKLTYLINKNGLEWVHHTAMACDDNNPLPEHLSSESEIEEMEKHFEFIIRKTFRKENQSLITVAR